MGLMQSCFPFWDSNDKKITFGQTGRRVVVRSLIAEGGFSFVYMSDDSKTGSRYALKKMLCQTPERLEKARWEIEVFKIFGSKHENICELVDNFEISTPMPNLPEACVVYMLLPFYEGGSLQDLMDKNLALRGQNAPSPFSSLTELLAFFEGILRAVQYFHQHDPSYALRDLKPGNVMLCRSENHFVPVLIDFASVAPARMQIKTRKEALQLQDAVEEHSTPLYRPPELFDVHYGTLDERTDIWALGAILYACLFNKSPFEDGTLTAALAPLQIPQSCDVKIAEIIRCCLSHDISSRPFIPELLDMILNVQKGDKKEENTHAESLPQSSI